MSAAKKKKKFDIPAGDAEAGKKIFEAQCSVCHSDECKDDKAAAAPSLGGVYNRIAGSNQFPYSNAMKKSKMKWDEQNLFGYLNAPGKFVPGNKMSYAGLTDPQDRANLIAYLKDISK